LMVYLNNPSNQDSIRHNADRLSKAMVSFLSDIHNQYNLITQSVQN
jgi:hypothetical protein